MTQPSSPVRRALLFVGCAMASLPAAAADSAADYQRSLTAVAEVDAVAVKIEAIANRRKGRRLPEVQACLDDKAAEARKLQKVASEHHGRMVEAMADRKTAAAWEGYRAVVQVQAQARKLAGGAEGCRMLGNAEEVQRAPQAPRPEAEAKSAATPTRAPNSGATLAGAVVGSFELELD